MPEGEKPRVILSSDQEARPSREQRAKQEAAEKQKEKLKTREYLDKAVLELKNVLESLPKNSKEAKRAEHTLKAVEWALGNLGKNGAAEGKYRLEMKDHEGKPAKWPDGKQAVQDEGVPVDELIELLKGKAKDLNTEARKKENVQKKKKEMDELWERYNLAHDVDLKDKTHDKAWVYSQWEKAKKAFEAAQEAYDLGFDAKGKELEDLAEELHKRSETHFKAHYNHELPLSKEESDKQNVRTTHEAYLVHGDYRKTGDQGKDYQAAMDAMGKRRELVMKDVEQATEEEAPKKDEGEAEKPKKTEEPVEPGPKQPEPGPDKPKPETPAETKKPERIAIVNAEAQMELLARDRADKRLTEMLNHEGKLKRWWYRAWEHGYRQQLIDEERKKILGQENKPGWFKRKLFGAKEIAATGKKNLFAGTGKEAENQAELSALATRFSTGLQRESEGEQRKQLEDPEFNAQINDLVYAYATSGMSEGEFEGKKDALVAAIAKKYPGSFADGKLTADNFLEAARDFRKIQEHSKGLARADVSLSVDLGLAKQSIKTKANLNWVDKMVTSVQKYPVIGHVVTPGMVGFGASVVSYFSRKPLMWLGGAAGMGGVLGGMRRNAEQKRDLEMHRRERAMGNKIGDYGTEAKRRKEMERFVYEMKDAGLIKDELAQLNAKFETDPNPENAAALTRLLAETEARMTLSEEQGKDLISFEGESSLERGRLYLMKELAEAKVKLNQKGFVSNIPTTNDYKGFMKSLGGEMQKIDKSERSRRWKENAKAAAIGAVAGLVVGTAAQEAAAYAADHVSWLSWMRPGGKATSFEKLMHNFKHDVAIRPSGGALVDQLHMPFHGGESVIKVDSTMNLIRDPSSGFYNAVDAHDPSNILAKFDLDPATGKMTPIPGTYDPHLINLAEHVSTGRGSGGGAWIEQVKDHLTQGKVQKIDGRSWYDNPLPGETAHAHNLNELRFYVSTDSSGDMHFKVPVQEGDSWLPGGKMAEVGKAFDEGRIKMLFVPDGSHPGEAIVLDVDAATKEVIVPKGDVLQNLWDPATGKFKGGAFGLAENTGGDKFTWLSSDKGMGEKLQDVLTDQVKRSYEVSRNVDAEWWGVWGAKFGRRPLETQKAKDKKVVEITKKGTDSGEKKIIQKEGDREYVITKDGRKITILTDKDLQQGDWFEDDGWDEESRRLKETWQKQKTVVKKGETQVGVVTRGQKAKIDKKDYSPGFVGNHVITSPKDIATQLVDNNIRLTQADAMAVAGMDETERKKYLERRIQEGRVKYEAEAKTKEISEYISSALKAVDLAFAQYDDKDAPKRNPIINKEKIHLMDLYDYMAHSATMGRKNISGGCCWVNNATGDIFVNMHAFSGMTPEQKMLTFKHVVAHEAVHGSVANNFWGIDRIPGGKEDDPKYKKYLWRRAGLVNLRLEKMSSGLTFTERGRALNEAVTEELAIQAMDKLFNGEKPVSQNYYKQERAVLRLIQEKLQVDFKDFARAAIDRRALPDLVKKVEGYKKGVRADTEKGEKWKNVERPKFMPLLMSLMDHEMKSEHFGYELTKALVEGKPVVLSQEVLSSFPSNLLELDADGNLILRKDLQDRYPNITVPRVLRKAA